MLFRTAPKSQTYGESTPGTKDGAGSVLADAIGGKLGGGRGELNSGLAGRKGRGGGSAEDHNSGGVSHRSFSRRNLVQIVSAILNANGPCDGKTAIRPTSRVSRVESGAMVR